jgi:phosphatidylglycerophosphatase A
MRVGGLPSREPAKAPTPEEPLCADMTSGTNSGDCRAARPHASLWATLVATFLGAGLLRPAPGSWASAATVLLWWLVSRSIAPSLQPAAAIGLAALAVAAGIPAATRVARATGLEDPQFVVIDEDAGQLITLIWIPVSWKSLLLGFILFRAFDIAKPPPVRSLERFREGTGIVVDDVGAGLYALAVMHILLHYGLLPR